MACKASWSACAPGKSHYGKGDPAELHIVDKCAEKRPISAEDALAGAPVPPGAFIVNGSVSGATGRRLLRA
jgi:hypothetical protein